MKFVAATIAVVLALLQVAMASVYSQLQFMKIISPTSGQSIRAGETVEIKYAMQPLVYKGTSNGFAKNLNINFHKRAGNTKQQQLESIVKCPVTATQDKFKTYSKSWVVPANTEPGSYAFDFVELVQLRRGQLTATETVKVNVVD
ncbi:unnamed protein product [Mucor hiemalis]